MARAHAAWLLLTAVACAPAPPRAAVRSTAAEARPSAAAPSQPALPAGVHLLSGTRFDLPDTDLEPLGQMIGERWLVALGESDHTSGGYYQMKARVMRFLVEKKGFRVLAIETPWGDALEATRWLERCDRPLEDAMAAIFPVYRDRSLAEFLAWACTFNRAHPTDPVSVWGFDVQQPWHDVRELVTLAAAATPSKSAYVEERLRACNGSTARGVGTPAGKAYYDSPDGALYRSQSPYPQARADVCRKGLADVGRWLESDAQKLTEAASAERVAYARIALTSFSAFQEQVRLGVRELDASQAARDAGMADTFAAIRELHFQNSRIMLWAHNHHLAKAPARLVPPSTGGCTLGEKLSQAYGDAYFPIALVAYRVKMNWGKMKFSDPPMRDRPIDLEQHLHVLGVDAALADLRADGGAAWKARGVTAVSGLEAAGGAALADQFAAAIYLEESPPMVRTDVP